MSVLKSIREEQGFTQSDLAFKTGLSLRTIQRLEATNNVPKGFTLSALSKELGMEPSILQGKFQQVKRTQASEISTVKLLNLSILSFLGIPFGNLIFPIIIWQNHKKKPFVDDVGRRIVNFQILFSLGLCLLLILSPFTLAKWIPSIPVILIIFALAYTFNIVVTIITAVKIQREDFNFLNFSLRLI